MHIVNLIKTASSQANKLAMGAIILLLAKIFIFNRIPEIFPRAYELGFLSDAILTSIVASYIFYLLVIHLKEQADRETVRPYISKHAKRIVGDCQALITEISNASGKPLTLNSTKTELEAALKNVAPKSEAPLLLSNIGRKANWLEFISYRNTRTKASCRKLLDQLPLLDAKLISLVAAIDDCSLFVQIEMFISSPFSNKDMAFLISSFHSYTVLCAKLDTLINSSDLAYSS